MTEPLELQPEMVRFVGQTINGQYELLEAIGKGAMGVVFRARQLAVGREVAVKILHRHLLGHADAVRRFENEARSISLLRHPNTLRLYDCQRTADGDFFLVTELLAGRPLSALLAEEGRLGVERTAQIADQICRSLAEAHAAGIVHRDLKPENVFLDRVGAEDVVKVLDFGIAKIVDAELRGAAPTNSGVFCGTPRYMSPEQASSEAVDHRSDIYALGVMIYELISGRLPFEAANIVRLLHAHIYDPPPPLRSRLAPGEISEALNTLVMQMLAKAPRERPESVQEVRERLAAGVEARASSAPVPGVAARGPAAAKPRRVRRAVIVSAYAVAIALSLAAGFALTRMSEPQPAPLARPVTREVPPTHEAPPAQTHEAPQAHAPDAPEAQTKPARPEKVAPKPKTPARRTPRAPKQGGSDLLPVEID